jgi:hypothetical protein
VDKAEGIAYEAGNSCINMYKKAMSNVNIIATFSWGGFNGLMPDFI